MCYVNFRFAQTGLQMYNTFGKIQKKLNNSALKHGDGPYFAALAASDEAKMLRCGGLHTHPGWGYPHDFRQSFTHLRNVRSYLGCLQGDGYVNIAYIPSVLVYEVHYAAQEYPAVYAFELVRIVREVMADVSKGECTEDCVTEGVYCNVSIGVCHKAHG